ncbi:MAG: DNA polymerase III subunit beta, partial [Elusimicrobia bacterium RIFOXYB2_FULL_49_7]
MKFPVRKENLVSVLQKVINIVPVRSTLQILSNIHVRVDGSTLSVRATDLDLSIHTSVEIKPVPKSRDFIVNARKFFDIVKELPETDIELELDASGLLRIATAQDEFKLPIQSPDEFPENPDFNEVSRFTLKGGVLDEMSTRVRFATARDTTRVALKGVLCELEGSVLRMVATDGHKLSLCKEEGVAVSGSDKISLILPPKALDHLSKILIHGDEEVAVRVGKLYAQFIVKNTVLTTKLIEGEYPNYEEAIPKKSEKKGVVRRDELFAALKRISVMSNSRTRQVRFAFNANTLTITTSDRDFHGEGRSAVTVKYEAEPLTIGFNPDFFIEILRLLDSEEVVIGMNTPLSATLILPSGT